MSIYYLRALQGEKPYCDWYGLPAKRTSLQLHPERIPPDCPHNCMSCPKCLIGECGFFDDDSGESVQLHPEKIPPDCPHHCMSCPKWLIGECGFFDGGEV